MNSASSQMDAQHVAGLDRLIAEQEAEGDNPWLARALRETALRQVRMQQPAPTEREQIAQVLLSGLTGTPLFAELWRRFPTSRRADVFAAASVAITVLTADVVLAGLDRAVLTTDAQEAA